MKKTNATKFGAILLASTMLAGSWSSVAMADESEQTIDTATWFLLQEELQKQLVFSLI